MNKPYPLVDDLLSPVLRVAMPRAARLYAPEGTVHVVTRCNNREFYFTTPEDFELLLAHLRQMLQTYSVTLYAYTLMANHLQLLLQAPKWDALGRPMRWFMTETANARKWGQTPFFSRPREESTPDPTSCVVRTSYTPGDLNEAFFKVYFGTTCSCDSDICRVCHRTTNRSCRGQGPHSDGRVWKQDHSLPKGNCEDTTRYSGWCSP